MMIRDILVLIEDWMFDEESIILGLLKIMLVFGILLSPIIYLMYKHEQKLIAECIKQDGKWQVIGHHQETTYIKAGNVYVPSTSTVADYGCVMSQ